MDSFIYEYTKSKNSKGFAPIFYPLNWRRTLKNNKKVLGYPFNGYWLDIGRPEDYETATEEFEKYKSEFLKEI